MLLIGEVSKISQVSLRMLRYYDKKNIFKPSIINEENGYRYYTADQLDELYRIVELRDLGFSVAEIGELVRGNNKEKYLLAIGNKRQELENHSEYTMSGPTRQICHVSPANSNNPEEYITEILITLCD